MSFPKIIDASSAHIQIVYDLAHEIWPLVYGDMISKEQIEYMLNMMYSQKSLQEQIEVKHHNFMLLQVDGKYFGYASFERDFENNKVAKLHKLYIHPEFHGCGFGRKMLDEIVLKLLKTSIKSLVLNVNKYNPAVLFYKRMGFEVVDEIVLDIGSGYVMDDYIMKLSL